MAQFKKQLYEREKKVKRKKNQEVELRLKINGHIMTSLIFRNITCNVEIRVETFHIQQLQLIHSPIQKKLKSAYLNLTAKIQVTTRMWKADPVKRSSQQEPKEEKGKKSTAVDIDQQYLESLKEIGKRMEETSNNSDRMILLSLLPAMKQLSPLDNMYFRVDVQEALRRKLRRNAARDVEQTTYPSKSSALR